ncbi:MAG: dienelactone hydrolase family protein [Leptolyngbyaceae bacterium]|nr:dienelactone hydrolase family protein [Leptolyngbyaceae bacterium]
MTDTTDITTRAITLQGDAVAIAAYQAQPTTARADAPVPGIVVLQEIFGVNAHIRNVTDRLAKLGYVAIAPALYQRLAPGFETGYDPDSITLGRQYKQQTKADELLADIQTAIDHLKTNPGVNPAAIGCIGFCFGGHVAYLAATLPDIKATASFYGAGITTWCPGDGEPTLIHTGAISGTLYGFFGMADQSIPPDQVDAIEEALQQHRVNHRIFRYADADHGFFCDQRGSYNAIAAADAWTQVQTLFQQLA